MWLIALRTRMIASDGCGSDQLTLVSHRLLAQIEECSLRPDSSTVSRPLPGGRESF